jgi:hypothetical protein
MKQAANDVTIDLWREKRKGMLQAPSTVSSQFLAAPAETRAGEPRHFWQDRCPDGETW